MPPLSVEISFKLLRVFRTENEERGTRPGNEARETLWPHPNSVTGTGNEDPPCVDMGGRVTLFLDV